MSDNFQGGVKAGATSASLTAVLRSSTTSAETTGKVAADMTLSYMRQGGTSTSVTASDLAAVNSAYSSGGVKEIDSTGMPGAYRVDWPNAAFASGADWVQVAVKVSGCFVFQERIPITSNVIQTGDNYARIGAAGAGLTALGDTRIANLDATVSSRMATYTQPTGFLTATFPSGTIANTTNITAGTIATVTTVTNQLTAAQIATGVWQDTTAGDFTTAGSIGKSLGGAFSALGTSVYTAPALANAPSGTGASAATIATAVWQDITAGDFTVANSVGKSIMNGVALGTGLTVNDITTKTGYALTSAYDPAKTASQAGDAMALTSGERNSTADALLARNVSGGSSTGRTVKQALHFLRNKFAISGGTMTVYDTDDTTSSWTSTLTTTAGDPVSTSDPA